MKTLQCLCTMVLLMILFSCQREEMPIQSSEEQDSAISTKAASTVCKIHGRESCSFCCEHGERKLECRKCNGSSSPGAGDEEDEEYPPNEKEYEEHDEYFYVWPVGDVLFTDLNLTANKSITYTLDPNGGTFQINISSCVEWDLSLLALPPGATIGSATWSFEGNPSNFIKKSFPGGPGSSQISITYPPGREGAEWPVISLKCFKEEMDPHQYWRQDNYYIHFIQNPQ